MSTTNNNQTIATAFDNLTVTPPFISGIYRQLVDKEVTEEYSSVIHKMIDRTIRTIMCINSDFYTFIALTDEEFKALGDEFLDCSLYSAEDEHQEAHGIECKIFNERKTVFVNVIDDYAIRATLEYVRSEELAEVRDASAIITSIYWGKQCTITYEDIIKALEDDGCEG